MKNFSEVLQESVIVNVDVPKPELILDIQTVAVDNTLVHLMLSYARSTDTLTVLLGDTVVVLSPEQTEQLQQYLIDTFFGK